LDYRTGKKFVGVVMVGFRTSTQPTARRSHYPPYHSKYTPVERPFGWLEQHWNGSLLDLPKWFVEITGKSTYQFGK